MPLPTKDQWQRIEQQLAGPFGRVELKADGYSLVLVVTPYKELKYCIAVYVDGWIKGEWLKGEAPEAKKFCQERRRWLYPARKREEAKQALKSRRLAFMRDHYKSVAECQISTWSPHWLSAKLLTRHLRKTCTDIAIVSLGYRE